MGRIQNAIGALFARQRDPRPDEPRFVSDADFRAAVPFIEASKFGRPLTPDFDPRDPAASYHRELWVYACVRNLSRDAATIPIRFYDPESGDLIEEGPLVDMFDYVNPWCNGYALRRAVYAYLLLNGRAYLYPDPETGNIWYLPPQWVTEIPDPEVFIRGYEYAPGGNQMKKIKFATDELLRFVEFDPSSLYNGMPGVEPAQLQLQTANLARKWDLAFYKNNARPDGYLQANGPVSREIREEIATEWEAKLKGVGNAHRTALLPYGMNYQPLQVSRADMKFLEGMSATAKDIMTLFDVNDTYMGLQPVNLATARQQELNVWNRPIRSLCDGFSRQLEQSWMIMGYTAIKPDYSGVLAFQYFTSEKFLTLHGMYQDGVLGAEEYRDAMGYEPTLPGDVRQQPAFLFSKHGDSVKASAHGKKRTPEYWQGVSRDADRFDLVVTSPRERLRRCFSADEKGRDVARLARSRAYIRRQSQYEAKWVERFAGEWGPQGKRIEGLIDELAPQDGSDRAGSLSELRSCITLLNNEIELEFKYDRDSLVLSLNAGIDTVHVLLSDQETDLIDAIIAVIRGDRSSLDTAAQELYRQILKREGDIALDELGAASGFDVADPSVTKWVIARGKQYAQFVSETTAAQVTATLAEGFAQGETAGALKERVRELYTKLGDTTRAEDSRAWNIARTETNAGANRAQYEGFDQSGVVESREWLDSADEYVREAHVGVEPAAMGKPFIVGGFPMMHPSDSSMGAGPELVCNCRCNQIPVITGE